MILFLVFFGFASFHYEKHIYFHSLGMRVYCILTRSILKKQKMTTLRESGQERRIRSRDSKKEIRRCDPWLLKRDELSQLRIRVKTGP
jgi:hypothetical protein